MTGYLVASSNPHCVDYAPWSGPLTITFRRGSGYEYYGGPAAVCQGLLAAESPGRFHPEPIKYCYSYKRIL